MLRSTFRQDLFKDTPLLTEKEEKALHPAGFEPTTSSSLKAVTSAALCIATYNNPKAQLLYAGTYQDTKIKRNHFSSENTSTFSHGNH